jgi:hypothetical protein
MPPKRNKRELPSPSDSISSPPSLNLPTLNLAMEASLAALHAKFDQFSTQIAKIDVLEQTISKLVKENTSFREEITKKDAIIEQLSDKVNRLDQSLRSNSLRIHGLPIDSNTPAAEVPNIVFKEIILPIFETAKQQHDLPPSYEPVLHHTLVSAFSIPSKKNSNSCPVIVKFYSEFLRSLVFKHKRAALPTTNDLTTHRVRPRFSIYEDLTAANHTLLRSFADDPRVKSAWSYGGQVRFKTHDDSTYKASSLSDTFDKLVKPPPAHPTVSSAPIRNRFGPLTDLT